MWTFLVKFCSDFLAKSGSHHASLDFAWKKRQTYVQGIALYYCLSSQYAFQNVIFPSLFEVFLVLFFFVRETTVRNTQFLNTKIFSLVVLTTKRSRKIYFIENILNFYVKLMSQLIKKICEIQTLKCTNCPLNTPICKWSAHFPIPSVKLINEEKLNTFNAQIFGIVAFLCISGKYLNKRL